METTLIIPIHEHGMSSHLVLPSSISFISVSWFPEYRSWISFGRFILGSFIPVDVTVNGTALLIALFFKMYLFVFGCAGSSGPRGLSLVAESRVYSLGGVLGLLLVVASFESTSSRVLALVVVHRLRWHAACGIFLEQGLNPCPLHSQADNLEPPGKP